LAQLLINRGLVDSEKARRFLYPSKADLHDPFKLRDMKKAADRIKKAIRQKEKMLVYGDYDADGITAVAILFTFLKGEGAQVDWYIPNRLQEGYGLNMEAAELIISRGTKLLITVDCGTSDKKEVEYLNKQGVEVIIVDHHRLQGGSLPHAFSLINPWQPDCKDPFKELCAAALAYKLTLAISGDTAHENEEYLDLVAVGTVADVAPQTGENRILTRLGLKRLSNPGRVGLRMLMDVAGLSNKDIRSHHIGFIIGPRINVSGRIGSPELALKLLLAEDKAQAREIAEVLNQENGFRQRLQEGILKEAITKIEGEFNFTDNRVIVVWGDDWHPGVIGIVASKIADRFYRPAIVLSVKDGIAKGSGRSIERFHLFDAVSRCSHLLSDFGGHEAACGLKIPKDNMERFRDSINSVAREMIGPSDLIPKMEADMELQVSRLNAGLIEELGMLEPFGEGNPQPLFVANNLRLKDAPVQHGRQGVKMWVTDKNVTCQAFTFSAPETATHMEDISCVDMVYYPRIRKFSGISTFELQIEDLKANQEVACRI
jgi:single-stranded-DNA-specific exonuclease